MKKFLFIVLLMLGAAPANAQQQLQALIVSACGTLPVSYVAGTYGILTMDTTGKLCDGGGGGGGGGSVTQGTTPWVDNITQWANVTLGAATAWGVAPTGNVPGVNANVLASVLPTGAATQTTLASVLTNLPNVAVNVAPVTATNPAVVVDLRPDSPGIIALGQTTKSASVPVTMASDQGSLGALSSQYPGTATAVEVSTTGTTAATAATMPAVSSKTNYVCGFTITADATALATGTAVLSGLTNSLSYLQTIVAVTSGTSDLTKNFNPCIPASATNTAIVITSAAAGTGGNTIVNIQGYVQ